MCGYIVKIAFSLRSNTRELTINSSIVNTESQATTCYDLSGRKLNQMQRGINILRMKDGTSRKVLIK